MNNLIDWILAKREAEGYSEQLSVFIRKQKLETSRYNNLLEKSETPKLNKVINEKYNKFLSSSLDELSELKKARDQSVLLSKTLKNIYIQELDETLFKAKEDPILGALNFLKASIEQIREIVGRGAEKNELELGIEIEKEHKPTYEKIKQYLEENKVLPPEEMVYQWITEDHLVEIPDYNTRLIKMEKEVKEENNNDLQKSDKDES